jgi:GH25 family lysozyme M1 (1,4-beta-N-acetylmuramidase)
MDSFLALYDSGYIGVSSNRRIMAELVKGIDFSRWETSPWNSTLRTYEYLANWEKIKVAFQEQKIGFCSIKATQGTYMDFGYKISAQHLIDMGMPSYPYHYYDNERDPVEQGEVFSAAYNRFPFALPPAGDFEQPVKSSTLVSDVYTFLLTVAMKTGKMPFIYTSPGWWNDYMRRWKAYRWGYPGWAIDFPLWVANIGVIKPQIPKGFNDWTLWQYSWKAQIDGLLGEVDANYFNGTSTEFRDMYGVYPYMRDGDIEWPKNAVVLCRSLYVRTGAGKQFAGIAGLVKGEHIQAYEEIKDAYGNIWIRISDRVDLPCEYCARIYNGNTLVKYL